MALNGDLTDLSLPDLFYLFQMRGMTGRLALQSDQDDAVLYFQKGKLVYVASSRMSTHLGQLALRQARLTVEQLGAALAIQVTGSSHHNLGEILVQQGWLSPEELNALLLSQAEDVLYRVLAWTTGSFNFVAFSTAPLQMPLRNLNVEQIILEAARRADEQEAIKSRIPSLECGVVLLNEPVLNGLADADRLKVRIICASILQGSSTLRKVVEATGIEEHDVMKIAYDLVNAEALAITKPPTRVMSRDAAGLRPSGPLPGGGAGDVPRGTGLVGPRRPMPSLAPPGSRSIGA